MQNIAAPPQQGRGLFLPYITLQAIWSRLINTCYSCCILAEVTTGVKRNENIGKLQAGYLFPEVCSNIHILCPFCALSVCH